MGKWPTTLSGSVGLFGGDTWRQIDRALQCGTRGLKPDTLADLLVKHDGFRNKRELPRLTVKQILKWADEYHRKHGKRPTGYSGPIGDTGED